MEKEACPCETLALVVEGDSVALCGISDVRQQPSQDPILIRRCQPPPVAVPKLRIKNIAEIPLGMRLVD